MVDPTLLGEAKGSGFRGEELASLAEARVCVSQIPVRAKIHISPLPSPARDVASSWVLNTRPTPFTTSVRNATMAQAV